MSTITKQQAIDRLKRAIKSSNADDLVEIHNELFPEEPITEDECKQNRIAVGQQIVAHIENGLEVEEIVDLWNVVFPAHNKVWFEDDVDLMHYDEEIEPAGHME